MLYQLSYRRTAPDITPSDGRRALRRGPPALYPSMPVKRLLGPSSRLCSALALLGLLVYGVTHQAPSRTLDQALIDGRHPLAPQATRALPVLTGGERPADLRSVARLLPRPRRRPQLLGLLVYGPAG